MVLDHLLAGDVRLLDHREGIAGAGRASVLGQGEHEPPVSVARPVGVFVDGAQGFQPGLLVRQGGQAVFAVIATRQDAAELHVEDLTHPLYCRRHGMRRVSGGIIAERRVSRQPLQEHRQ